MAEWVIRAEGVNFDHTVFHTQNLAVIRGASAALETAMTFGASDSLTAAMNGGQSVLAQRCQALRIAGRPIYVGASQLAWHIDGATSDQARQIAQDFRDWLATPDKRGNAPPTEFMSILVDVGEVRTSGHEGEFHGVSRAHIATRYRQMRAPNFPGFAGQRIGGTISDRLAAICPIDGRRPIGTQAAGHTVWVPRDRYPRAVIAEGADDDGRRKPIIVSPGVARLMHYGRRRRVEIYNDLLGELGPFGDTDLVKSFDEIVADPPDGLSRSAEGKMAVIHVDGAGFGALRDRVGPVEGLGAFAKLAQGLMDTLLATAVSRFVNARSDDKRYRTISIDEAGNDTRPIRFETLLRAGDEFSVVVPGWLAWDLTGEWFRTAEAYNARDDVRRLLDGDRLTLRVGCLICSQSTPIRKARGLAYRLQEEARCADRGQGAALFQILESVEAPEPDGGFVDLRQARYGVRAPALFGFGADTFGHTEAHIRALKGDLPRSQLRKLIGRLQGVSGVAAASELIDRGLRGSDASKITAQHLLDPRLNHDPGDPPDFSLKILDDLWDYVDPFEVGP